MQDRDLEVARRRLSHLKINGKPLVIVEPITASPHSNVVDLTDDLRKRLVVTSQKLRALSIVGLEGDITWRDRLGLGS